MDTDRETKTKRERENLKGEGGGEWMRNLDVRRQSDVEKMIQGEEKRKREE